jgi:PAS domain S-box-containing protein
MATENSPHRSLPAGLEAEALLRKILDESRDAILVGDAQERVRFLNLAAEELLGRSAADIVDRLLLEDIYPPGVWRDLRRRFLSERGGGSGRLAPTQTEVTNGGGDRIPVDVSATALVHPDRPDAPEWMLVFVRDVRLQTRLGERLAHAQAQLEQEPRPALLAELAGTAAHELNQPLTSILGYSDLLRRRLPDGSTEAATVDVLIREAERMAEIIRKMRQVRSYQTKSYIGESRIVDLDQAVGPKEPGGE